MPTTLDYIGNLMGPPGPTGPPGADSTVPGPTGPGVPNGGTTGQVLEKLSATDQDTAWAAPSGGGAAAFRAVGFYPPVGVNAVATTGSFPARLGIFAALADVTVTQWIQTLTSVAGKTYRLALYEVASTRATLASNSLYNVDIASPGAAAGTRIDSGTIAWDLTAGKLYGFVVTVTDGTNLQINAGGSVAQGAPGALLCAPAAMNGVATSTVVTPVSGSAITAFGGSPLSEITAVAR